MIHPLLRVRSKADQLRIIVTGLAGLHPVGGVAWDYLQYVLGFARLGHDTYYHEDTWSWPYHPVDRQQVETADYSVNFLSAFFRDHAPHMRDRWHYVHLHDAHYGMPAKGFEDIVRTADLYIDVSGANLIPDGLPATCIKVFIDTDPGYNQIVLSERPQWSKNVGRWCATVAEFDRHFTYAENIHAEDCLVPHVGFSWQTTRMPVVLECWTGDTIAPPRPGLPWSTVMTWNAFPGKLVYRGVEYFSKGREFSRLLELPSRSPGSFKVALGGKHAPCEELRRYGWEVVDGPTTTLSSENYRSFIADSCGEISPAKHVYVAMRTGWFSCRTACYLAAGRPAIVQDTGLSKYLPSGEGLFVFNSLDDVVESVAAVEAAPAYHRALARELAVEYLDSDKVLTQFIEDITSAG
jgi:hypothetical protein